MNRVPSNHVERIFRLLVQLQSGRYGVVELAERCSCSRRAVQRDIQVLRDFNYPVAMDSRSQRWYLATDWSDPQSPALTPEEAALLTLAAQLSPLRRAPSVARQIDSALTKIFETFPSPQKEEIRRLLALCELEGGHSAERREAGEALLGILCALRLGKKLRVTYCDADDQVATVTIIPYRLVFSRNAWQLIGRTRSGRKPIQVEVGRIRRAVPFN